MKDLCSVHLESAAKNCLQIVSTDTREKSHKSFAKLNWLTLRWRGGRSELFLLLSSDFFSILWACLQRICRSSKHINVKSNSAIIIHWTAKATAFDMWHPTPIIDPLCGWPHLPHLSLSVLFCFGNEPFLLLLPPIYLCVYFGNVKLQ